MAQNSKGIPQLAENVKIPVLPKKPLEINGIKFNPQNLMSKDELLEFLKDNGESDRALSRIRERQYDGFGNELIWRYPISDGKYLGTFIAAVKEGFVSIPYDTVSMEVSYGCERQTTAETISNFDRLHEQLEAKLLWNKIAGMLSEVQIEILHMCANGYSVREIAALQHSPVSEIEGMLASASESVRGLCLA